MGKYLRRKWFFILILIIVVVLFRFPSLEQPFDNDSGANAYHARLILRGEPLYSTHHPAHHLPGVYYTYALAFLIFGDSTWAVKFLLIPWTIITAYFIYLIGTQLSEKNTGILASLFFVMLSSQVFIKGNTAESELFANLPITAAILTAVKFTLEEKKDWRFIFVGAICALAFLYKFVFLSPIIIAGLIIIIFAWLSKESKNRWKIASVRIIYISIGFLIPLLVVSVLFARLGLFDRLLLVFTLGQGYVVDQANQSSLLSMIVYPFYVLTINNLIILLLSLVGILHILRKLVRKNQDDHSFTITSIAIIFWFGFSILGAGITRRGWAHYSIIILPSISILAAWEIIRSFRIYRNRRIASDQSPSIFPLLIVLIVVLFFSGLTNFNQYYHFIRYKIGKESHEGFLIKSWPVEGTRIVTLQKISEYLQNHTTPDDFIYYWSDNPQLYYYSDRRSPIDIIWPSYAETTGSYLRIFSPMTKYIIVGESIFLPKPEWLDNELKNSYQLETDFGGQLIFKRKQ